MKLTLAMTTCGLIAFSAVGTVFAHGGHGGGGGGHAAAGHVGGGHAAGGHAVNVAPAVTHQHHAAPAAVQAAGNHQQSVNMHHVPAAAGQGGGRNGVAASVGNAMNSAARGGWQHSQFGNQNSIQHHIIPGVQSGSPVNVVTSNMVSTGHAHHHPGMNASPNVSSQPVNTGNSSVLHHQNHHGAVNLNLPANSAGQHLHHAQAPAQNAVLQQGQHVHRLPVNHVGANNFGANHHWQGGSAHWHGGSPNYQPAYTRHAGVYHGHWNGNRTWGGNSNGYGFGYGYSGSNWGLGAGYGYSPYYWGFGGWGLGSLAYGSGYLNYSNPYYLGYRYGGASFNYSQPIPVSYGPAVNVLDPTSTDNAAAQADVLLNAAIASFKQNDYDSALDLATQGIIRYPDDAVLHEFSALCWFAKGNYQRAAATIHSVLAVGPGWDWSTLSSLYADVNVYTLQLRALEAAVKQNPNDSAQRFLLAYHYLSDGYPDAAARQLTSVVELTPGDTVAAELLKMVTNRQAAPGATPAALPIPQPPPTDGATPSLPSLSPPGLPPLAPPAAAIDPAALIGQWSAAKDDGSTFVLILSPDKAFTWSFAAKGQRAQPFEGTYTLEGNVISLERSGGGSLVGEITPSGNGGFNFKLLGAPSQDPGLNFSQSNPGN